MVPLIQDPQLSRNLATYTRGSILGPEKCLKELIFTRWTPSKTFLDQKMDPLELSRYVINGPNWAKKTIFL